ncbi:hypothetical protein CEXT_786691 [Caerostris extrusa]|uniref:Uncharacterized protein n=1 Tax=Caerostris extrusa TaxID=172846 RepID=A0AAV4MCJ0_CAEEX|nr:hypothetical protein CEXT_786691 [Caerostris extrusa]
MHTSYEHVTGPNCPLCRERDLASEDEEESRHHSKPRTVSKRQEKKKHVVCISVPDKDKYNSKKKRAEKTCERALKELFSSGRTILRAEKDENAILRVCFPPASIIESFLFIESTSIHFRTRSTSKPIGIPNIFLGQAGFFNAESRVISYL